MRTTTEETMQFNDKKAAARYLQEKQDVKPFTCPFLLVANTRIKTGSEIYEKGELLCSCMFLDSCGAFTRVKMDFEGNIAVNCRRHPAGVSFAFRNDPLARREMVATRRI